MARSRQDLARSEELADTFTPGMSVTARAKGFPAWPAVVVKDSDVPQDVKAVKPGKKVVLPVLFYNDNSFLWVTPEEVQPLSREVALKNSQAKVKRTLKDAYAMVVEAPDNYADIMAMMFPKEQENGAKSDEVEKDEQEMQVEEEPRDTKSRRARSAAERAAEQGHKTRPLKSRKRASESPAPSAIIDTKKTKKDASKKTQEIVPAEEEEESEYIDQTEGNTDGSDEQDLQNSQAARLDLCNSVRATLQENLLVEKIQSLEPVEAALKQYEEAPEIEIAVVRKAKLNRVVSAALSQPLPTKLLDRLAKLSAQWETLAEPVIRGIPEHLAPREESEIPESREQTPRPESREATVEPKDEETDASKQEPELPQQETEQIKLETEEPNEENGGPRQQNDEPRQRTEPGEATVNEPAKEKADQTLKSENTTSSTEENGQEANGAKTTTDKTSADDGDAAETTQE